MQPDIERCEGLQDYGQRHSAHANTRFETSVKDQDTWSAIYILAAPETAQGQPGHKRRQDRAHRQDRIAEQQMQHTRPGHFVEQAADPREEKES